MELNMNNLENCLGAAKDTNARYIGVKVKMQGFPKPEIIINENENIESKLEYYKKAYNDNLTLKTFDGIKIIGFTFGDTFSEIEWDLHGDNDGK